jgi:nucleoside phosphorylase
LEYDAVRKHLPKQTSIELKRHDGKALPGFSAVLGDFEGRSIVAICSFSGGEHRVSTALNSALYQFSPSLTMFIGIGGGFSDEAKLGTVIISDYIGDHSRSIESPNGTAYMFKGGPIDPSLLPAVHEVASNDKWLQRLVLPPVEIPESVEFARKIIVGRISAGNVLVTTKSSKLNEAIADGAASTQTIEMESAACYDCATVCNGVPFLAIRGISDRLADKNRETDVYQQPMAAALANAVAFEFLDLHFKSLDKQNNVLDGHGVPPLTESLSHPSSSESPAKNGSGVDWSDVFTLINFSKRPEPRRGRTVTLRVKFTRLFQPASETECRALGLAYGDAITRKISLIRPQMGKDFAMPFGQFLHQVFATGEPANWLELAENDVLHELTLRLEFGKVAVRRQYTSPIMRQELKHAGLYDENEPTERIVYVSGLVLLEGMSISDSNDQRLHLTGEA